MVTTASIRNVQQRRRRLWPALSFAVVFAALGTYLLLVSHAAIVPLQPSVTWKGNGDGILTNVNSGLCLSAPGTSKNSNGTQLLLATCDKTQTNRNEYWSFLFNQNYTLENGYNQCLTDTNSSKVSGAPAQVWDCTAAPGTQQWVVSSSDNTVRINGLCLGVNGNATSSGSLAVLMSCNAAASTGGGGSQGGGGNSSGGDSGGGGSTSTGGGDSGSQDSGGGGSDSFSDTSGGGDSGSFDSSSNDSGTFDFGSGSFALGGSSDSFGSSDTGSLSGSSSTFNDKNVDKSPGHSGNSLKSTIGAIFVVFAIAVAAAVAVLWLRRKQHKAWESRGGDDAARKAVLLDSPPPPLPPEVANRLASLPLPPSVLQHESEPVSTPVAPEIIPDIAPVPSTPPHARPAAAVSPVTPKDTPKPPSPERHDYNNKDAVPDKPITDNKHRPDGEEREVHIHH